MILLNLAKPSFIRLFIPIVSSWFQAGFKLVLLVLIKLVSSWVPFVSFLTCELCYVPSPMSKILTFSPHQYLFISFRNLQDSLKIMYTWLVRMMYDCWYIKFCLKGSFSSFNERMIIMIVMNLSGISVFSAGVWCSASFIHLLTYIELVPYSYTVVSTEDKNMNNKLPHPRKVIIRGRQTYMYKLY